MGAQVTQVLEEIKRFYVCVEISRDHSEHLHIVEAIQYSRPPKYYAVLPELAVSPYPRAIEEQRVRVAMLAIDAVKAKRKKEESDGE